MTRARNPNEPYVPNPQPTPNTPGEPFGPNQNPIGSLGVSLGSIVDDARQLVTNLGLRPYRVFAVVVRWTGGELGRGECVVERTWEFLPTPLVTEAVAVRGEPRSGGLAERGTTRISRISTTYTEDQVRGLLCSNQLPPGQEGWLEVVEDSRAGLARRRRFVVSGQPVLDLERKFEWSATLVRQDSDRTRDAIPYPYGR